MMECTCRPFAPDLDCATHLSSLRRLQQDTLLVLRDKTGLLHFERDQKPVCGYPEPVANGWHPITNAAMWCTACMQTLAKSGLDANRDPGDETDV